MDKKDEKESLESKDGTSSMLSISSMMAVPSSTARPLKERRARIVGKEQELRLRRIVYAHFESVPQSQIAIVSKRYPNVVRGLYAVAQRLLDGDYGIVLEEKARSLDDAFISGDKPFILILFQLCHQTAPQPKKRGRKKKGEDVMPLPFPRAYEPLKSMEAWPQLVSQLQEVVPEELFIPHADSGSCTPSLKELQKLLPTFMKRFMPDEKERELLTSLFHQILENIINPSHVAVDRLLEDLPDDEELLHTSLKTAMRITKPNQRTKSLNAIVQNLSHKNRLEQALDMLSSLAGKDKADPLKTFIDNLLNPHRYAGGEAVDLQQIDQAVTIAKTIKNVEQREDIIEKLAVGLARNNELDKAITLVQRDIADSEKAAYTFASIVNVLSSKHAYDAAMSTLALINDDGAREDAIAYIIKSYLDENKVDQAHAVAASLPTDHERIYAEHLLHTGEKALRQSH